jgi:hypothetical protein
MGGATVRSHRGQENHGAGRHLLFVLLFNLLQLPLMSPVETVRASALASRCVSDALARNGGRALSNSASTVLGIRG